MLDLGEITWDDSTSHWRAGKPLATNAFGDLEVEFRDFAKSGVKDSHYALVERFADDQESIATELERVMPAEAEFELIDQLPGIDELPEIEWSLLPMLHVDLSLNHIKLRASVSWDQEHIWDIVIEGAKIAGVGPM